MTDRTWEQNADEFGAIERGDNAWILAIRVACSVEKVERGKAAAAAFKVSASEFARRAGVDDRTVSRYLAQWDTAAVAVGLPLAADLTPDDVDKIELPSVPFNGPTGVVRTRVGGANSATEVARNPTSLANAVAAATPETIANALEQLEPGQLSALADGASDALADKLAASELEDIAAGGRIPSKREITERLKPELPDGIADVAAADKAWESTAREMTRAVATLTDYAGRYPVRAETEQADAVKGWALALVDLIGAAVTA